MRSKGSSVSAALSSSSLYSSSSHIRCRVLRGSLSSTGMDTFDRSLPMLFRKMFQRLMLLVSGHGAGRQVRRPLRKAQPAKSPLATGRRIHFITAHTWYTMICTTDCGSWKHDLSFFNYTICIIYSIFKTQVTKCLTKGSKLKTFNYKI